MEYTDIRYSDITTCIDSVSARAAHWRTDVSKWIVWGDEQSHAYIIKHPFKPIDFLRWNTLTSGTVTLLRVLILWVPEQHNWRTDGLPNEIGMRRGSLMLTNQAPNWNQLILVMEYLTSGQWHYYAASDRDARAAQLEDGWSPNELCGGEQSHAYIIKHPIETQLTLLVMEYLHQVQMTLLLVLILWVPELENWRTDGLQMIVWGEQSHAYIIRHPISTQLTSCDGIHSHQVQWHYYLYWFCECQSWRTGGRMVSNELCGESVSCLHNQAPNWNTIDSLWWNTLTSGQWHYYVYWFCECQSWRTGGRMSPNELYEGEQSHAYIIKHPIETQFIETSVPQFSRSDSRIIHVGMSLYLDVSVCHHTGSQMCFNWVLDYVSMRLLSLIQFIWETIRPQFSSSGTHRINDT